MYTFCVGGVFIEMQIFLAKRRSRFVSCHFMLHKKKSPNTLKARYSGLFCSGCGGDKVRFGLRPPAVTRSSATVASRGARSEVWMPSTGIPFASPTPLWEGEAED